MSEQVKHDLYLVACEVSCTEKPRELADLLFIGTSFKMEKCIKDAIHKISVVKCRCVCVCVRACWSWM